MTAAGPAADPDGARRHQDPSQPLGDRGQGDRTWTPPPDEQGISNRPGDADPDAETDEGDPTHPPVARRGISPLDPSTMPRSEDDEQTYAGSPEFHDRPDPGPNVGRPPDR